MKEINRMKELISTLTKGSDEYYNGKKCSMADEEWDYLFDELKELESKTGIIYSESPTQNAGYPIKKDIPKIKHSTPLLSLDKEKTIEELIKWLGDKEGILMRKLDGGTQCVNYNKDYLTYLATRGSSHTNEGQDITHNARSIKNIPNKIKNIDNIQVVGEGIMYKSKFEEINSKLPEDKKYENGRNLANATSSMQDSKIVADREIQFIAFGTLECDIFKTKEEQLRFLKLKGFKIVDYVKVTKQNLREEVEKMTKDRFDLPYDIDGLVLAFNDLEYGNSLGRTERFFKNAIAYKFKDDEHETVLRNIKVDVGKSGQISYVGEVDTVNIDGSKISQVTLNNYDYIRNFQIGIGDSILIIKSNQVIPKMVENLSRSGTYKKIEYCPVCGSKLVHKGVHQYCINYNCERQIVRRLAHWCSRDAMSIEGMSEETIKAMRQIKNAEGISILNTAADIYVISRNKDALMKLDRFGKRKVDKLCSAIEKSKTMPLSSIIYGLSIPQVGRKASKTLAENFKDIKELSKYHNTKGSQIGLGIHIRRLIGESAGNSFMNNFYNDKIISAIDVLCSYGLTMMQSPEDKINLQAADNEFKGKKVYATGTFKNYKKKDIEAKLESLGAIFANGYAKSLDYLLVGGLKGSSKVDKAEKDGVKIITEEEFENLTK